MKLIANSRRSRCASSPTSTEKDNGSNDAESGHHNWVMANEQTHAALKAKGYHYRFVFSMGVGHCDGKVCEPPSPTRWSGSGAATPTN